MNNLAQFNKIDIKFLLKYTKLSNKKLFLLLEEPRDSHLLMDAIARMNPKNSELRKLGIRLLNKITVFRHTKDTNFDIDEKAYIADAIMKNLPSLIKEKHLLTPDSKADESNSEYFLILAGFFDIIEDKSKSNYSLNYYINFIENGFRWGTHKEVAKHVKDWVQILKNIRKDYVSSYS